MRLAYADPPYFGCGSRYTEHHPEALLWDKFETHEKLLSDLLQYDGWAVSLSLPSLHLYERTLIAAQIEYRICSWVKPFAVFRPNVNPAYSWEPVIVSGGRKPDRNYPTVRDWLSESITMQKGLVGAKPPRFCRWIFSLLFADKRDDFYDLFPGTGIATEEWNKWDGIFDIGGIVEKRKKVIVPPPINTSDLWG